MNLAEDLRALLSGEVDDKTETLEFYSHDASLFEVKPQVVVSPKHTDDVKKLVNYVAAHKKSLPNLSITARSAGTDMSGGAINDSIIADFNKHFTEIYEVTPTLGHAQPGVFYRDFEKATLEHKALMPSYPASRDLCTIGGMVNNNAGGEKSLEYGKTENFVPELQMVWSDGNEYTVKPLTKPELDAKMKLKTFEGEVYSQLFKLLDDNYDAIKAAKPNVTKNSTGYFLWNVWDRETGIFDLTKLIVGAQGTLGFVTDIKFRLVPARPHSGILVVFLKDIDRLGEIINLIMTHKPASFESFDDVTLKLSFKLMPYFLKNLGPIPFIKLLIGLIPDGILLLKGIPKLILMVEFNGQTVDEVREKVRKLDRKLFTKRAYYEIEGLEEDPSESKAEKFWIMRRQSFAILRKNVSDKHTAPFIDDLVVPPKYLPEFLPQMRAIIKKYKLFATIAGHMGDGNFHIIPLMRLQDKVDRDKLEPAMHETNALILKYHGVLSGEHNDGMIRGPWLSQQYGDDIVDLFRETKDIFDPQHIFNPHKKANADWGWSESHIRQSF